MIDQKEYELILSWFSSFMIIYVGFILILC